MKMDIKSIEWDSSNREEGQDSIIMVITRVMLVMIDKL